MSHFTTIKVKIKDGTILKQVLEELGYQVELNAQVRGYSGSTTKAEYVMRQSNGYDLGFRRNGNEYELVADFWGANVNQQQLLNSIQAKVNEITQRYAHQTLLESVKNQGMTVEKEEVLEDGSIRILVGKWV
jgi:hypothetical protein